MPTEKQREFIEKCYAQSRRMSRLLADMNTLTQLDEALVNRHASTVNVAAIINQIANETRPLFEERNIKLDIDIPQRITMQADPSMVYSLFRNIFDNTLFYAVNATRFAVTANIHSQIATFTLADNGPGVAIEHLPHIFERFYRVDKGRSRKLSGTGLGLAIVKNIALQYSGTTTASITPGGGLTIRLDLPCRNA